MLNLYLRTKNKSISRNIQNDTFIYNEVYLPLKFVFFIKFYDFLPFSNFVLVLQKAVGGMLLTFLWPV